MSGRRPGILDGFSRSDELLVDIVKSLENLQTHLTREEKRETRIVYFAYPNDGTLATLQAGTTTLDFKVGTIEDVDGVITRMSHSLQSEGRDWLRSFFVNSDKSITVQPDGYDKIPATEEKDALGTYQEFTKLKITCTEETIIFIACCTSPEAVVRLISNAMVITDPVDMFGNRTYVGAGELAARLGSINTFERRGNVMLMDNFEESTLKWVPLGTGTGNTQLRSNITAQKGSYSVKLTTGNAEDNYSAITCYTYMPIKKRIGAEISFALGSEIKKFYLRFRAFDGTYLFQCDALYEPQASVFYVYDDVGQWQSVVASLSLKEYDFLFHTLKMVFDLDTEKWIRTVIDNVKYDISTIGLWKHNQPTTPYARSEIQVYNNSVGNHYAYVDNFIITQNEPL
ncbi:hypothetical protein KA005_06035 [bacterium]|nr:hypothetical protein [bacterium]